MKIPPPVVLVSKVLTDAPHTDAQQMAAQLSEMLGREIVPPKGTTATMTVMRNDRPSAARITGRTPAQLAVALAICSDCDKERGGDNGESYCSLLCGGCGSRSPRALRVHITNGGKCPHPSGDKFAEMDEADANNNRMLTGFMK